MLMDGTGAPLDDVQNPASQLSEMPPDPDFAFIAAAADDFIFEDALDPLGSVQITNVRVAFNFYGEGGPTATPTSARAASPRG